MARSAILLKILVLSLAVSFFWLHTARAEELPSITDILERLKDKVVSRAPSWDRLIEQVRSAQAERAQPETYASLYGSLLGEKQAMEKMASELARIQERFREYLATHPELSPEQAEKVSYIQEKIDSLSVSLSSYIIEVSEIERKQRQVKGVREKVVSKGKLSIRGELSVLTGDGNLTDHDRQYILLSERYDTAGGDVFTFYQKYENDHSFINYERSYFGARQDFPSFLGGRFSLRESLEDHRDLGERANSRRQFNFSLDFSRSFSDNRTLTSFSYDYRSKNYRAISPRSYLSNRLELRVSHRLKENLTSDAYWKMIDFHYAQGGTLGYNATYLGMGLEYLPSQRMIWAFDYGSLEKSYDVLKDRAYFEDNFKLKGTYIDPEGDVLQGELRFTDHNRRRKPALSYNENRIKLRYFHKFNKLIEGDFSFQWRDKSFSSASANSYTYTRGRAYLNFYPSYRTSWFYNLDFYDYDYCSITRSYRRLFNSLGASYSFNNGAVVTAMLSLTKQDYSAMTGRDYTIKEVLADIYYPISFRESLRIYTNLSRLNQREHLSVNDYNSASLTLEYLRRLSSRHRLRLIYTYNRRNYRRQQDIRDSAIEARLSFQY